MWATSAALLVGKAWVGCVPVSTHDPPDLTRPTCHHVDAAQGRAEEAGCGERRNVHLAAIDCSVQLFTSRLLRKKHERFRRNALRRIRANCTVISSMNKLLSARCIDSMQPTPHTQARHWCASPVETGHHKRWNMPRSVTWKVHWNSNLCKSQGE